MVTQQPAPAALLCTAVTLSVLHVVSPPDSTRTLSGGSTFQLHFTDDKTRAQRCLSKLSKVTHQQVAGPPSDQVNIPSVHRLNRSVLLPLRVQSCLWLCSSKTFVCFFKNRLWAALALGPWLLTPGLRGLSLSLSSGAQSSRLAVWVRVALP